VTTTPPPAGSAPPATQAPAPPPGEADSVPSRLARRSTLRRFAKLWGFALFCLAIVIIFRAVVLPFLFALLVAYILAPAVGWLSSRRIAGRAVPRFAAVLGCYTVVLGVMVLFFTYFLPRLSGDFARLFREAPQMFRKVKEEYVPRAGQFIDQYLGAGEDAENAPAAAEGPEGPRSQARVRNLGNGQFQVDLEGVELEVRPFGQGYLIAPYVPEPVEPGGRWERGLKQWVEGLVRSSETQMREAIVLGQRFVAGTLKAVATFILVLMVAAFILVDIDRLKSFFRSLVPDPYHGDFDVVLEGIDRGLSGVIRGQLVICALNGFLTWIGLALFHVKYPLLLAAIAATMSLIPIFGSILSSVPIVAIAMVSRPGGIELWNGLGVLGWIVLIHLTEANFFNPKILGSAAKIHPVLVVFALLAGEQTYGLVGALFAVPVASIVQTLFVFFRRRWQTAAASRAVYR
jgi:predicted PurR-regulated permease PerM